jgi:hypothetical protein
MYENDSVIVEAVECHMFVSVFHLHSHWMVLINHIAVHMIYR